MISAGCVLAMAAGAAALPATTALAAPAQVMAVPNVSAQYSFTTLGHPKDPTFNQLLGINDFGEISGYFGIRRPAAGRSLWLPRALVC
jgi:hypothetical protein